MNSEHDSLATATPDCKIFNAIIRNLRFLTGYIEFCYDTKQKSSIIPNNLVKSS